MAIPTLSLVFMVISILIVFALPIGGIIYLSRNSKHVMVPFFAGVSAFFVMQMVIRMPLIQIILPMLELEQSLGTEIVLALILGGSAALFETAGRLLTIRLLVAPEKRTYYGGIAHGIGHGGIEALLLIGLNYISYIVLIALMGNPAVKEALFSALGESDMQMFVDELVETQSVWFLVAGLERAMTMVLHVALSLIIMLGFIKGRVWLASGVVIGIHMLIDFLALFLSYREVSLWAIEGIVLIFALVSMMLIWKLKPAFKDHYVATDEAEEAVKEGY